ncbi:unnamed protein product [Strongylus vulgaris]|uniref:Uncharacterized protein n=1 Tax=Strongylus vulgaris TaxID=40348 RepID=A0A3P7ISR1_STRVU|nr:unnamed protein product [Strongylus vulgaris]
MGTLVVRSLLDHKIHNLQNYRLVSQLACLLCTLMRMELLILRFTVRLSKTSLQMYCKPTLRRNAIPENKCKFSSGNLAELKKSLGGKRFDVILAPELLNRSEDEFEMIHQILDEALSHNGICLLSTPSHYFTVDSSLTSFLDIVKRHRQFDVIERWSSPRTDVVQRKIVQLTRSLC